MATCTQYLQQRMFICLAWYGRLYDILEIVAGKTNPRGPGSPLDEADVLRMSSDAALKRFSDYFSSNPVSSVGGKKDFFAQGADWAPKEPYKGPSPQEPTWGDFINFLKGQQTSFEIS
jgi:hypothetical protein